MRKVLLAVALCGVAWLGVGRDIACRADPVPSVQEILQRLIQQSQTEGTFNAQSAYLCTKQTVTEEMDAEGRVTERKIKVGESLAQSSGSTDANKWSNQNGFSLNEQLLQRYNFTLMKRDLLNGRATFILTFVPKNPPPPVRHFQDRLLNRAMGTIWVDAEDFELVKANICLGEPVSFGIFGAVDILSFAFERELSAPGNWLMHSTETYVKARKLFKPIQTRKRVDWRDFRTLDETSEKSSEARPAGD